MSWKGFVSGLRTLLSEPEYLKKMTPEERAERSRRADHQQMFIFEAIDPPKPHPYRPPPSRKPEG